MSILKRDELRVWMLGAATTGLFWQSIPAVGLSADTVASNAMTAKTKAAPTQPIAEPRPLPASAVNGGSNGIQLTAQTSDAKSEVQRQLEALYEQNGREMPDTATFSLQPVTPQASSPQPPVQPAQPAAKPATKPVAKPAFAPRTQAAPVPSQKPRYLQNTQQQYQPRHQAAPYPIQTAPFPNQAQAIAQPTSPEVAPVEPPRAAAPAPSRNPVVGFFRKISGSNRPLSTQAPVPPDVIPSVPNTPMLTAVPNTPAAVSASGMRPLTQAPMQVPAGQLAGKAVAPVQSAAPLTLPVNDSKLASTATNNVQTVSRVNSTPADATPAETPLPPLNDQPMPLPVVAVAMVTDSNSPAATPATVEAPTTTSATQSLNASEKAVPAVEVTGDFPNPFPDEPEAIADRKQPLPATAIKAIPKTTETPQATVASSSVNIPEAAVEAPQTTDVAEPSSIETSADDADEPQSINPPATNEDPFAVDGKDFLEPLIPEGSRSIPALGIPTLDVPPAQVTSPADDSKRSTEPAPFTQVPSLDAGDFAPPVKPGDLSKNMEAHLEKMNRIRERFGMKGLKGFCPVSLRDDRELVDAKPEYQFTYRKQKFHFSSAKAREKFEANPIRYAPAAYGADVVALTRDKDVIEGTLEYAAWYKGRLYLLGSQANYDAFLADPVQYATPDGIE